VPPRVFQNAQVEFPALPRALMRAAAEALVLAAAWANPDTATVASVAGRGFDVPWLQLAYAADASDGMPVGELASLTTSFLKLRQQVKGLEAARATPRGARCVGAVSDLRTQPVLTYTAVHQAWTSSSIMAVLSTSQ